MTNNAINSAGQASDAEAIAGVITNKTISPPALKAVLDTFAPGELWINLGLYYSSGTLTIKGASGADLSSGTPARIRFTSKASPSTYVTYTITANQTLAESDLTGSLFCTSSGIAWNEDLAFFLYAVSNDAENAISFMISPVPHRVVAPASANIGKTGSAVADTQGSFFAFGNPTVTDYDTNPCFLMGSFRMRKNSSDAWTVQALDNKDGFGVYQSGRIFNYPSGQQTAASGEWFRPNGGTAPTFTTNSYQYNVSLNGVCNAIINFTGDGGTAGSGAVNMQLTAPFVAANANSQGSAETIIVGTTTQSVCDFSGNQYFEFYRGDTAAKLVYSSFSAGARTVNGIFNYSMSVA